jgi:polyribonucleotide nucleotidyltransferase
MQPIRVEREFRGQILSLETGKLAKQAHGAVLVQFGETVVLSAAVEGAPRGEDFFPLTVDYRERTYAAGKFPGGFKKREGAPGTKEILTARLADRPIRPLFPEQYINEVQVMSTVLSSDRENDPDILSIIGASAALWISHMPFQGPIGAMRLGLVDNQLIPLPTYQQLETSGLDLVVAATRDAVCMIEGFAKELPEDDMAAAILQAHKLIQTIIEMQMELRDRMGKGPKETLPPADHSFFEGVKKTYFDEMRTAKQTEGKQNRSAAVEQVREKIKKAYSAPAGAIDWTGPSELQVKTAMSKLEEAAVRDLILAGRRLDGRTPTDLRNLYSEVGLLPRVHGSALFQRGETQALMAATLGGGQDEQKVDGLAEEFAKKFMLDYNFPPYSVGETRPIRSPGRREIGHGMLAERSLKPVVPSPEKFPYTIRLVSEILESNGSSSMATVCAGTLCLMDAGVPIKDPVAGISIGLVKEDDRHVLLTDIIGDEDHYGDMDFKVAGTQRGVTGIQLDLKIAGITEDIVRETLVQARKARIEILKHMLTTLKRPKKEISEYAPRLIRIKINPEKIGAIIGPGGKNIRALQESTGTQVSIEDDGTVTILGENKEGAEDCRNRIEAMTEEVKVGRVYKGRVSSTPEFGAFVEIVPGRDGLCHISELSDGFVNRVTDIVKVGDIIEVVVIGIDDHDRIKLSRKALMRKEKEKAAAPAGTAQNGEMD